MSYDNIISINKHKEGFIPVSVILIKVKTGLLRRNKINFYCPHNQKSKLDDFLRLKNIVIKE